MGKTLLLRRRSNSDLPRLHDLERAVQAELKDVRGREELFLRSTSELTSLMKEIGHTQGRAYFRYVLRDVFGEKSTLYEALEPPSTNQVCAYAQSVIKRLAKAIHFAPLGLRAGCHYMLTEFRKVFPSCKHDARIVVGSLLFLRILCPALIKPEMFDFPTHTTLSLQVGVRIAKVLQHTLSGTPVGDNDPAYDDSNTFIYAFQPCVANFLLRFAQIPATFDKDLQQVSAVHVPSESWGGNDVKPITPTKLTEAVNWPPSPHAESCHAQHPVGKTRCFSMSSNDAIKNKRKFSLRFWSKGPRSVTTTF
ncbi:hypothetical protein PsorP6_008978 [Peronosclerospora sorghi]|uniref:Uncharacterized protein n=1 Tax=Peronosclerospora sorghi TaxID=230839 RepID=A0ACC0VZW5_9STRA|nr:hypothetical protein PsorP6_008978 [Peronosclerospora sorghi]